jgi:hypothetical protein
MIVICGIRLMASGSAGGKSEAKSCITDALFGVLLAIGSWLLLNTINPLLLKDAALAAPAVSTTIATPPPAAPTPGVAPMPTPENKTLFYYRYKDGSGNVVNSPKYDTVEACVAQQKTQKDSGVVIDKECFPVYAPTTPLGANEAAVRTMLCGNNSCLWQTPIGINNKPCPTKESRGCTDVERLGSDAITMIKNLQTACSCNVLITGGTEHQPHSRAVMPTATHNENNSVVDIHYDGDNSLLTKYIKTHATEVKPSFVDRRYRITGLAPVDFWFTNETGAAHHWHVCPQGASAPYCQ